MRETEMEVLLQLCKTKKNPVTGGCEGDRRLRSEKLKRNEITITPNRKTETIKNEVQISVKPVQRQWQRQYMLDLRIIMRDWLLSIYAVIIGGCACLIGNKMAWFCGL